MFRWQMKCKACHSCCRCGWLFYLALIMTPSPNEENTLQSSAQIISCKAFVIQFWPVSYGDIVIRDPYGFLNAGPSVDAKWNEKISQNASIIL